MTFRRADCKNLLCHGLIFKGTSEEAGIRISVEASARANGFANLPVFLTRSEDCRLYSIPQGLTIK